MIVASPVRKRWIDMKVYSGYPAIWDDGYSHIKIAGSKELLCGMPLTSEERRRISSPDTPSPEFISCPKCIAHDRSKPYNT